MRFRTTPRLLLLVTGSFALGVFVVEPSVLATGTLDDAPVIDATNAIAHAIFIPLPT